MYLLYNSFYIKFIYMQNYCNVIRSHYHNNLGKEISDLKGTWDQYQDSVKGLFLFFEMQICLFFDSFLSLFYIGV